jgi:hypothetical protein
MSQREEGVSLHTLCEGGVTQSASNGGGICQVCITPNTSKGGWSKPLILPVRDK